mmetsp:Transcript_26725/g.58817  ORF Transcript_26725/g.58817 Transcript_26725/m.58817 type:complete len:90 (-) Transcript_26725:65-334(-)
MRRRVRKIDKSVRFLRSGVPSNDWWKNGMNQGVSTRIHSFPKQKPVQFRPIFLLSNFIHTKPALFIRKSFPTNKATTATSPLFHSRRNR